MVDVLCVVLSVEKVEKKATQTKAPEYTLMIADSETQKFKMNLWQVTPGLDYMALRHKIEHLRHFCQTWREWHWRAFQHESD